MKTITQRIAENLGVQPWQIDATIGLLDEGATVPFIARYRKEVTGGLDDTQLRTLETQLSRLRALEERRTAILEKVAQLGKMTPELEEALKTAETRTELEDLYLPYRPKRRTKASIAREAGLEPLALALWKTPENNPETTAAPFVNPEAGVADIEAALDGARHILMEQFSEEAQLVGELRERLWQQGTLNAAVLPNKEEAGKKFKDYFDFSQPVRKIPSHRALALFRGHHSGILTLRIEMPGDGERLPGTLTVCEGLMAQHLTITDQERPADTWLVGTLHQCWQTRLKPQLEKDLKRRLREMAEEEAIQVFGRNLQDLLLAPPAGNRVTMGLDPGLRTGVKVAVVDTTGKVLEIVAIYPHPPRNQWNAALETLARLSQQHKVDLISIGNGTASRETDRLVAELIRQNAELSLTKVIVNEAGASVYSASELASNELPDMDVSFRGAVSIARRLQEPLAELVKIEPKSIGVGQYQHDVDQKMLAETLDAIVEDSVNAVGVELNTASPALLTRVAGLNATLADNIVAYRNEHGPFASRDGLKNVARLGPKTFEQAAGFLRIRGGENPLDASAVHPEAYPVVERIVTTTGRPVADLIGDSAFLSQLPANDYTDAQFGLETVQDILKELEKPGRDPRPEFRTATFQEDIQTLEDLSPGLILEGVVSNVTNFGAFVDIGVHQDGLVHISEMSDKFVSDPHAVTRTGDVVKVRVLEVDLDRSRIALSFRLADTPKPVARRNRPSAAPRTTEARTTTPTPTPAPPKRTTDRPTRRRPNESGGKRRERTTQQRNNMSSSSNTSRAPDADMSAMAAAFARAKGKWNS